MNLIPKLFDAKSNTVKEIEEDKINIYVCGPTVYDDLHIGNLRPLIFYDLLIRFYEIIGKKVDYLTNITDIDDKIINRFLELENSYKNELELANYFTNQYLNLYKVFNLRQPNKIQKVSQNIEGIKSLLNELFEKDFAYFNQKDLLFDTTKINDYGNLSKLKLDQSVSSSKNNTSIKKNEADFTLWKQTQKGLKYPSIWNEGRPGWHSECAYFIYDYFKHNPLTIHGGGIDLKFPHHENERAQFKALTNQELAKIYSYVGHVTFKEEKISKSLGNSIYINKLLEEYDPNVLKSFILFSNYKKPLSITQEVLVQFEKFVKRIENLYSKIPLILNQKEIDNFKNMSFEEFKESQNKDISFVENFVSFLIDDFNMQNAQTVLIELTKKINPFFKSGNFKDNLELKHLVNQFIFIVKIINLEFLK